MSPSWFIKNFKRFLQCFYSQLLAGPGKSSLLFSLFWLFLCSVKCGNPVIACRKTITLLYTAVLLTFLVLTLFRFVISRMKRPARGKAICPDDLQCLKILKIDETLGKFTSVDPFLIHSKKNLRIEIL